MEEQELEVPWGQITYTFLGNKLNQPVLLIHDLHDNASTFDKLLPELSPNYYYAAIDLPGHGKSSHLSPNGMYHYLDYILAIKYAVYSLFKNGNKKIILIGHSAGAHLTTVFAQVYPKLVTKLILLEGVYDYGIEPNDFVKKMKEHHEAYFAIAQDISTKSPADAEYSFQDLEDFYIKKYGPRSSYDFEIKENASNLAHRASQKIDNGKHVLRNDIRLDGMLMHAIGRDYSVDLIKKHPVLCPVLILCNFETMKKYKDYISALKERCPYNEVRKMGDRNDAKHFHVCNRQETVRHINKFLDNKRSNKL